MKRKKKFILDGGQCFAHQLNDNLNAGRQFVAFYFQDVSRYELFFAFNLSKARRAPVKINWHDWEVSRKKKYFTNMAARKTCCSAEIADVKLKFYRLYLRTRFALTRLRFWTGVLEKIEFMDEALEIRFVRCRAVLFIANCPLVSCFYILAVLKLDNSFIFEQWLSTEWIISCVFRWNILWHWQSRNGIFLIKMLLCWNLK